MHAKSEMERVGVMHRDVERYSGTSSGIIQAPSLKPGRKVHRMKNPGSQRLADRSFLNESAQSSMGRSTAQMMVRSERQSGLSGGPHHLVRIGEIQSQRLLA